MKIRSRLIGPPSDPPNWLKVKPGLFGKPLVTGVEFLGAKVLEQAAMPLVGAGAAEQIHLTATMLPYSAGGTPLIVCTS